MHRLARPAVRGLRSPALRHAAAPRRLASTASPAGKGRSWKSSALRWGVAVGAVYYYTTSSVFADEATADKPAFGAAPSSFAAKSESESTELPTVESVLEERRKQNTPPPAQEPKSEESKPAAADSASESAAAPEATPAGSPADLEEEAGQQGAFNPETGEINWDCPCLGGMADGPCGEQFKEAFSCFVHSTEEPKGMDCIEKFQGMQECFRQYPEIYGAELADDEEPDFGEDAAEGAPAEKTVGQDQPTEKNIAENTPEIATKAPESDKSEERAKPVEPKPTEAKAVEAEPVQAEAAEPEAKKEESKAAAKPEEPKGPKWEDATAANAEATEQQK